MSVYKYETNTFSLSDDKRFNKWVNENKSYDLSASPIQNIFSKEALQVDISPDNYKGLSLSAGSTYDGVVLTEEDVQAYFSKYPHHDASLTDPVYYGYIKALKNGQSTLDAGVADTLPSEPEESIPSGGQEDPASTVQNTNSDGTLQAKLPDAPAAYLIEITTGNYSDEILDDGDIKFVFSVSNRATNLYESIEFIPGSLTKGYDIDDDEKIKNLAKAYFKDLVEKYPDYELKDKVGLFADTNGDMISEPAQQEPEVVVDEENLPEGAPYLETTFDDQRYSERLFIGLNNLEKTNPFDMPTTVGYLLFSDKMIKDHLSNEKHWMEILTSYTVPEVNVKPSKSAKKDKSDQLGKKDFDSLRGEEALLGENIKINDFESKLNKYNLEKLKKQFAGNTAFPDLENGINKLRGNENVIASMYGEVLHRINIRELLVRAMACIVAKLNPGDWTEIACKTIVKEVAKEIGFAKVKKIILDEWDTLTKTAFDDKGLEKLKKKLQEAEESGVLVDRKKSKNLTIIDGKDPFSQEFGQIQQLELQKEKQRNISNKVKIDDFVKDIKDIIDLDALCERFGEFVNDATKLLFAPGGLGFIKNNLKELFPGIPKMPTLELPQISTKDIMEEAIRAAERAARELIVSAIVDLVKGIIDEALAQCEDVLTPPPVVSPESSITIPDLVPNIPGGAGPVNYDDVQPTDVDDLGIPNHMAVSVKELLDWMAQYLKPVQLCKLLSGTASEGLLRIVLSQIEQRFENLSLYVKTTADVHRLFKRLGEKVDQTFCTAVVSNVAAISNLCEDTIEDSIHEDALRAKGFSNSEIDQIVTDERNRKLDALEKLTEYFVNPDAIQTQVPQAFCTPTREGLVPRNPPALTHNVETAVETIFDSIKYNFEQDSENLKDEYVKIGPVVTNRFKVPQPGEDFSKELRAIPITAAAISILKNQYPEIKTLGPVEKTGKYFLIDDSLDKTINKQIKDTLVNVTLSNGSEVGVFGPVYEVEQKRTVLPDLQDVFQDSDPYIRSTHYEKGINSLPGDLILINPNNDPEAKNETIDPLNPNKPINLFFKSPGFDVTELKTTLAGITKQINNSSELDTQVKADLQEQQSQLQSIINSANQSINNIILTLPTVQQSIRFAGGKVVKMQDNHGLTVREKKIIPYEERLTGVGSDPTGPGYITSYKNISRDIDLDSSVGILIQELLSDLGETLESSLIGADPFQNSNNNFLDDPEIPNVLEQQSGITLLGDLEEGIDTSGFEQQAEAGGSDVPGLDPFEQQNMFGGVQVVGAGLAEEPNDGDDSGPTIETIIDTPIIAAIPTITNNKYKDNYKAFKAVLFAKLISRKYKEAVIEAHANHPDIGVASLTGVDSYNEHFYHLDNTLISLYEKQLFNLTARLGFNPFKESPLMNLATFQKFDITPDDPETLASNKCLPENSAGSSAPNTLLDIDAIKKFVSDNYQRKSCIPRKPGDLNPLKESILEAGILTMIKVSFVEYCFNSLIALTTGEVTQNFANEQTANTIADKFDEAISRAGAVTSDIVYSTIVKYLRDQLKLNIDLLDPMTPDNLLLQITDENITKRKALKFLCKKIIVETLPTIDALISDVKYDFNISGLEGLLNAYGANPNKLFNPPSAMNAMMDNSYNGIVGLGPNSGRIYKVDTKMEVQWDFSGLIPKPDGVEWVQTGEPGFVESFEYHTMPNITFDPKYENEILSNELDPYNGTFFLEKYIRIEHLHSAAQKIFLISAGDADNQNSNSKTGVISFENFERMILFQTILLKILKIAGDPMDPGEYKAAGGKDPEYYLEYFGLTLEDMDYWQKTFGPDGNPEAWKGIINFKVGTRLMYKMPSSNLLPLKNGEQPDIGTFVKNSPMGRSYPAVDLSNPPVFQSQVVKKEFEKIQFREASYIVRTISDQPTDAGVIAINDHFIFPIAEFEHSFGQLNDAIANGNDSWSQLTKVVLGPALNNITTRANEIIDTIQNNYVAEFNNGVTLPRFNQMKNLKSLDILPLLDPSTSYNYLESDVDFPALVEGLKQTPEVKLLTEHILPPELFKSMASEYMYVFPKSKTIPNSHFFNQTRSSLVSLFNAAVHGDDFRYRDPGGAEGLGKHKHASKRRSTQINILPAIQKLALETVPMIVKGMAETVDPAVSLANKITIATGRDPKDTTPITLALMPPPLFPPLGFNSVPITPFGMAYLALDFAEPFAALIDNKKNKKECEDNELESEDQLLNSSEEAGEGAASEEADLDGLK